MIKKTCKFCGSTFHIYPYRKNIAKYCSRSCGSSDKTSLKHNAWKGGLNTMLSGYVRIRINKIYIYEHRYIMEQFLNRKLKSYEVVHHIDGNRANNNIENLELFIKNKHDSKETSKRWKENPTTFNGKERCLAPRFDRHAKGKPCQRFKPCPHH